VYAEKSASTVDKKHETMTNTNQVRQRDVQASFGRLLLHKNNSNIALITNSLFTCKQKDRLFLSLN